jgi:formamidopyrimidine-DNA glycosylase
MRRSRRFARGRSRASAIRFAAAARGKGERGARLSSVPELPEVETIRTALVPALEGRQLERVSILDPRLTAPYTPDTVAAALTGDRVVRVGRRGKYVVVELSSGRHLLVHLRMTGSFRLHRNGSLEDDPYRRAVVRLDDGSDVTYRDVRRFGTWTLLEQGELEPYLGKRLGPEPLDRRYTARRLGSALQGRRAPVKSALLDQRTVAGVGNIYADEALWCARIHPLRPAGSLDAATVGRLHRCLRAALRTGIERQGATLRDYRDPTGAEGSMQDEFKVYGRRGEPCLRCRGTIERLVVGGRSSFYCPRCQRGPVRAT